MAVSRQFIDAPGHTEVYVSVVDAMKGILEGRFYKTSGGNGMSIHHNRHPCLTN